MRATILTSVLVLAGSTASAGPQDVAQGLELGREAVEQNKRVIVAGSLPLSDSQADAFWPLFDAFQKDLKKIDQRSDRLIADYVAEYGTLSGARARAMIDEALGIEEDRVKLKRRWLKRMEPVLPPRLLARYFQLENKFQAVVAADLSRQIPLVP